MGSSPRVRGKLRRVASSIAARGLIPACAGKTGARILAHPACQAHPRVCGENGVRASFRLPWVGSSPRVRGKRFVGVPNRRLEGLIPACAGKTRADLWRRRNNPAHPRVCGENESACAGAVIDAGSSPRVRGKRVGYFAGFGVDGLIPACAGKTTRNRPPPAPAGAHPRVCGENFFAFAHKPFVTGSSPRVRGKRP